MGYYRYSLVWIFFLTISLGPNSQAQQLVNPYGNQTIGYEPYTGKLNCGDDPDRIGGTNFKMFNAAGSICNLPAGEFDRIITAHGSTLKDSGELLQAMKKSEVTIAGDVHLRTDAKALRDVISTFLEIKGSGACVALELPQTGKGLADFMAQLKLREEATEQSGDKFQAGEQRDVIQYYQSIINFAERKNAKVFGVDHPDNFEKDVSDDVRNESMTTHVSELIEKKSCSSVLLIVGKAHLHANDAQNASIPDRLKARGLERVTINLQMTDERKMGPTIRTWDTCREPAHQSQALILKRDDMPKKTKIMPRSGEEIRMQDFDFTYLIPYSQNDVPCWDCV